MNRFWFPITITLVFISPLCAIAQFINIDVNEIAGKYSDYADNQYNHPYATNISIKGEDILKVVSIRPIFCWGYVDDGGIQVAYEIEVGTDHDWAVVEFWDSGEVSSGDSSAAYNGRNLQDGAEYNCRIRLKNEYNWGDWVEFVFRTNSAPPIPTPYFPPENASLNHSYVAVSVYKVYDEDGDALIYYFAIYRDSLCLYPVYGVSRPSSSSDTISTPIVNTLVVDSVYWWRARLNDGYEYSDWSRARRLNIRDTTEFRIPEHFADIQTAIDYAGNGDRLLVDSGIYIENLDFKQKAISLIAIHGPDHTFLQPLDNTEYTLRLYNIKNDTTLIDGFTVRYGGQITTLGTFGTPNSINSLSIIHNCIFYDNIIGPGSGDVVNTGGKTVVKDCIFYNNGGINSISAWSGDSVINNTLVNNERGIYAGGAKVRNNIVAFTKGYGIKQSNYNSDYNLVWRNGEENVPGEHGLVTDPMLNDPLFGDVRLLPNSPAIDAGDTAMLYNDADGTRNDIGAISFGATIFPIPYNIMYSGTIFGDTVIHNRPYIYWSYFNNNVNDQSAFEVEVGNDQNWFTSEMWSSGIIISADTAIQYNGNELLDDSTYFVRIRVRDVNDWGEWRYSHFRSYFGKTIIVPDDFSTIAAALEAAETGDTVFVRSGEYFERLIFPAKELKLIGENPYNTIINGGSYMDKIITFDKGQGPYTELSGFTITGRGYFEAILITLDAKPTLKNNIFRGLIAEDIIKVYTSAVITRNLFLDNVDGACIRVYGRDCKITNNTFDNNERGIRISYNKFGIIHNNIISNTMRYGIYSDVEYDPGKFDFNDVWNNGPDYDYRAIAGPNCISADPLYVNPEEVDYNLTPQSPCINTGNWLPAYNDPDGSRNDMGAFAFGQAAINSAGGLYLPKVFHVFQNYPNPFNPSTSIKFTLPHGSDVTINIYNILGQKVTTLISEYMSAGEHLIVWNGLTSNGDFASSGVYFCKFNTGDHSQTLKMLIVK